jgi:dihydroorotate dehydrogenase (NAD+) catalytic subunit
MMIAGASAVQVGTANFRDPFACIRIIEGLERFAASLGLKSIAELTGTVLEW